MSKYSELQQRRDMQRKQRQRRQLLRALRNGDYDKSTTTHTLQYKGEPVTVSEAEYLWLAVRGHVRNFYSHCSIEQSPYLTMKESS